MSYDHLKRRPSWATTRPTMKATYADLKAMLEAIEKDGGPSIPKLGLDKARMVTAIITEQDAVNEALLARVKQTQILTAAAAISPTTRTKIPKGFAGITAAECNAWLATLPPTPFAGEE